MKMKKTKLLMAFIMVFALSFALYGCGTDDKDNGQKTDNAEEEKKEDQEKNQEKDQEKDQEEDADTDGTDSEDETEEPAGDTADVLGLGTTIELDEFEITVESFEITDTIVKSQYTSFDADEGNKYIVVSASIKNLATSSKTFLSSFSLNDDISTKIVYQDTYEFKSTNLLGYSDDLHNENLNPLSAASGVIVFEITDEIAQSGELVLQFSSGAETMSYDLR